MLSDHSVLSMIQQVEPLQMLTGIETENRYRVEDEQGQPILFAYEESGFMGRLRCFQRSGQRSGIWLRPRLPRDRK